jgi:hypothetical protein
MTCFAGCFEVILTFSPQSGFCFSKVNASTKGPFSSSKVNASTRLAIGFSLCYNANPFKNNSRSNKTIVPFYVKIITGILSLVSPVVLGLFRLDFSPLRGFSFSKVNTRTKLAFRFSLCYNANRFKKQLLRRLL